LLLAAGKKPTQAAELIEIATRPDVDLFHTADGVAFADITVDGHRETWSLNSRGYRRWLRREFYNLRKSAPNSDAMSQAMGVIDAMAHFDGEEREVYLRVANVNDVIYLDLCNDAWQVVKITDEGWEIVDEPPVRFRRKRGMQEIPRPLKGTNITTIGGLKDHLNVDQTSFVLVVSWLLAVLRGVGPYPVLGLTGEQGTGKTMLARLLQMLVDPRTGGIRSMPKDSRDLYIAAMNGHLLVFDNLSGIPAELADCLCRLSTGGGFATRSLYTDDDEVIFEGQRPIALTSINDVASRSDLADRALLVQLEPISEDDRKLEKCVFRDFNKARPAILGALLDVVSHGLMQLPTTNMNRLPRMADFALWARACEGAIWETACFTAAYDANRADATDTVLDSDEVATALRRYLLPGRSFVGTATALLEALNEMVAGSTCRSKFWPQTPKGLSGKLTRLAPALRNSGIAIDHYRVGKRSTRMMSIKREEPDDDLRE
jgi:energy-coupling factor transporter ATP-binding protein EcfA2